MYSALVRKDVLHAINEFLDDSVVLPPGICEKKDLLRLDEMRMKAEWMTRRRKALRARPTDLDCNSLHVLLGHSI